MRRTFKYRIYLNKPQQEVLHKNFNFCCFLYNSALQERKDYFSKYRKLLHYNIQASFLKEIKVEFIEQTKTIYSQNLQQVLKTVDIAYQNFFRRVKSKANKVGFPRFKPIDRFNSITFPQCDMKTGGIKLLPNNKLKIFGIPGEVKIKLHRPFQGRCKTVTIKKQSDKFYIILSCEDVPSEHLTKTNKIIAIDLGLNNFITTDDGTLFHHPKPYKTSKEKLAHLQQSLAVKQRGSNNRKKLKRSISKLYDHITNVRQDFLHKISNQLVKQNDKIIIEKLNIKSMLESKGFEVNKGNIQDASWASFAGMLHYKAERAGREK